MKYAGVIENDTVDCDDGLCVSFWTQGCPHKCKNCHNMHTWDKNGGIELREDYIDYVEKLLIKNGIKRHLSILGGEPFYDENIIIVNNLIEDVKKNYPTIKIYIWSGYTLNQLINRKNKYIDFILKNIDFLIDGLYIDELKNITLKLRGSSNQHIYQNVNGKFILIE